MTPPTQLPARYGTPAFLAEGTFGQVYRAELPEGPVAVKVLAPRWLADPDVVWAFDAEARRLAALAHPAFPKLADQGVTADGRPYFAMTFLPGLPPAAGDPEAARRVLAAVAEALRHLHARGLVHGDLKLENVLAAGERVSLLDVGLARPFGERRQAVAGTLEYAAPEVLRLADVAPEADWYAFGVLGYMLVAGRLPFEGAGPGELVRRQLQEAPVPLPGAEAGLPKAIMGLLAKDPGERARALPALLAELGLKATAGLAGLAPARWQPREEQAAAWNALQRPGAVVQLAGPAGAGKSQLLNALRLEATLAGGTWLAASGDGAGAPGAVARLVVRQALAAADQPAEGPLQAWLDGQVPPAWLDLEPRARKLALQGVLAEAWQALGPIWVGLDDWERVDAASREVLEALAAGSAGGWCLAGGLAPAGATVVELRAWEPEALAALVASRLGGPAPAALLAALADVGASWPGPANVLVEHWHASGALAQGPGGWSFAPAGDADPWAALWRERLNGLDPTAARLVGLLAAWEAAGALPAWALGLAPDALEDLARRGVIQQGPGGVRLAPMPAGVRPAEPADASAEATRLARLLAARPALAVPAAWLALAGDDAGLAFELAAAAGRQALDQLALDVAAPLLAAARQRLDARRSAQAIEVCLANAELARLQDRKEDAAADLQRALELAEGAGDEVAAATALAGLAKGRQLAGAYADGLERAVRATALAERAGARGLAARAAMIAARNLVFLGRLAEARQACARAAALAAEGSASLVRANALNLQGVLVVQDDPGQRDAGLALIREALGLAEAGGDPLGTFAALENLGNAHLAVGELREAEDAFRRCAAICTEHRVVAEGLSADMNLALVLAELGEPAGHALAVDVVARAAAQGRAFVQAVALAVQGQAAWRQARFEEAFQALDEALAKVLAIKNRFAEEYIRLYRLEAYLAAGALTAARDEAVAAAAVVEATQHAEGRHRLALARAQLALLEGDAAAAVALAEPLLALGHRGLAHGAHHVLAAAGGDEGHLAAARQLAASWQAGWHLAADELALARAAADPGASLAHARAALAAGPNPFARAGAAALLASVGQASAQDLDAVQALLSALSPALRATVLAAQGLPGEAALAALAPAGPAPQRLAAWLGRILDAPDERATNEAVLEATLELAQADRGYLLEYQHGRLVQVITGGMDYALELERGFSSTIVEEVLLTGEAVYSFDAAADERWSGAASVHALGLQTVIGVPYGTQERLLGVVYVERAAVEPVLGPGELGPMELLARAGAERVLARRREQELLEELAFEGEVARAALAVAQDPSPAGRQQAFLAAALRLTGAERAFWLERAGTGWQAAAAAGAGVVDAQLPSSVLARAEAEGEAICLVESDEAEGWTPGQSVLALGLRMIWCVPVGQALAYMDTQQLTAAEPERQAARLAALASRLFEV